MQQIGIGVAYLGREPVGPAEGQGREAEKCCGNATRSWPETRPKRPRRPSIFQSATSGRNVRRKEGQMQLYAAFERGRVDDSCSCTPVDGVLTETTSSVEE